ncbi:MAG: helix-turn-helix domain-containing protein [Magnetococcus sp. XQGC-1]
MVACNGQGGVHLFGAGGKMSRKAKKIVCDASALRQLNLLARSRKSELRVVERARMVLACLDEQPIHEIALLLKTTVNTVVVWRDRFARFGVYGLTDLPRSGRPPHYATAFRESVLHLLETPPPLGHSHWSGVSIAKALQVSEDAVSRLLRKEGIRLSRQRNRVSTLAAPCTEPPLLVASLVVLPVEALSPPGSPLCP